MAARSTNALPPPVKQLFWDVEPRSLRLDRDQEMIIGRVLASGPWETVKWLRSAVGDEAIRRWIEERDGRGLSARQLRYWQLVLGIPDRRVDTWLQSDRRRVWDRRVASGPKQPMLSSASMAALVYHVQADWDPEADVWVATSDDVPGLATEASTIEALTEKLRTMIPELLEANQLVSGAQPEAISFELTSHRQERVRLAS
jgi:predicted RNase H-like HicB family nuclease